jgi:peptidyl-Lys metalloendopeptidase
MAGGLKAKLVAAKSFTSDSPVRLRFELTNASKEPVHVLKWFTPLEGIASDCLSVTRDGKRRLAYDGPMVKRGTPGPDDYVLLKPGETVGADVDVSDGYAVTVPAEYEVELKTPEVAAVPAADTRTAAALEKTAPAPVPVTGGRAKFRVKPGTARVPTQGEAARATAKAMMKNATGGASASGASGTAAVPLAPTIVGGTAAQQTAAKQAHKDGFDLAEAASKAVKNDAAYKKWFGAYTAARAATARDVYKKIVARMKAVVFTYDLTGTGCRSGVFAYTFKCGTTIWFCGAFWAAPATGTDSKAGTVVHEHSHSDANTDDLAYGQAGAMALATSSPAKAIKNADNYEYFAGG